MSFKEYIREMKRLGWSDEELKDDYRLHEQAESDGFELPWFPYQRPETKTKVSQA
ncbi:MAG: hypothetical protein IJI46_09485 [Erysipelotrichaceae bacterium]|nr:hypothetical protein [Erysipelotrichaceae bacterium]